jgi:uncharacterized protein YukE
MADTPPGDDNYDTWTWKQIETAILGGVDMSLDKQAEATAGVSSPQTFNDAADIYRDRREELQTLHNNLQTWLTQDLSVHWKGKGADAFKEMIQNMLDKISGLVHVLDGPRSYMQALTDGGEALGTCMQEIADADHEGAQATIDRYNHDSNLTPFPGPVPWRKDGGTTIVAVSTYPDIVAEMTRKMRASIKKLAGVYKGVVDDLRDPEDPVFATPTGNGADPAPIDVNSPPMDGYLPLPVPGKTPLVKKTAPEGAAPPQEAPPQAAAPTPAPAPTPPPQAGAPVPAMDLQAPAAVDAPNLPRGNLVIGQPARPPQPSQAPDLPTLTFPGDGTPLNPPDGTTPNLVYPGYDPSTHLAGVGNMAFSGFAPGVSSPDGGHFLVSNAGGDFLLGRPAPVIGPITVGNGPMVGPMAPLVGGRSYGALRSGVSPQPTAPGTANPPSSLIDSAATAPPPNFITASTGPGPSGAPAADGGAPMVPGMIGRRSEEQEHDTASWLVEHDDEWDGGMPSGPSFLNRSER